MASSIEHISHQIFKIVKGFGHEIVLFDEDGKKTVDPEVARRFYIKDLRAMINLDADMTSNDLTINLSKGTEIDDIKDMLNSLRKLSSRYILNYTVKTFGKTIGPKDFSFMAKKTVEENISYDRELDDNKPVIVKGVRGMDSKNFKKKFRNMDAFSKWLDTDAADDYEVHQVMNESVWQDIKTRHRMKSKMKDLEKDREHLDKQGLRTPSRDRAERRLRNKLGKKVPSRLQPNNTQDEAVNEGFSGWHGSAKKSVNELGDARLVVKHRRSVDEEKRGARTRQIESIFIENSEGERFKFPSKNITAAKAMVRHVKEGGTPFDDFGQYIYETMEELDQLKKFNRKNRRNDFFEDASINEEITSRVNELRSSLKQISGVKGYQQHFENFTRESADVSKEKLDELKDSVTIQYFDESISESLPYVAKVIENMRGRQEKESHITELARYVMDNKDGIELSRPIDGDDPENPSARNFRDSATAVSAWVNYLAPMVKDDKLANLMMQASDSVFEVGSKHVNMAAAAISVIKKKAQVAEGQEEIQERDTLYSDEMAAINETFSKYDVKYIFRG